MQDTDGSRDQVRTLLNARTGERRIPADAFSVLVVDDEAYQREALIRVFTGAGLAVLAVPSAMDAFEALRVRNYRAIVCDIGMPDQSGLTFYAQLEERFPNMAARVVFVTAHAGNPDIRATLERTGQPFFPKPYDVNELVKTVKLVVRKPFYS